MQPRTEISDKVMDVNPRETGTVQVGNMLYRPGARIEAREYDVSSETRLPLVPLKRCYGCD